MKTISSTSLLPDDVVFLGKFEGAGSREQLNLAHGQTVLHLVECTPATCCLGASPHLPA